MHVPSNNALLYLIHYFSFKTLIQPSCHWPELALLPILIQDLSNSVGMLRIGELGFWGAN